MTRPTVHEMMFFMNAWALAILSVAASASGQWAEGVAFISENPFVMVRHLLHFALRVGGRSGLTRLTSVLTSDVKYWNFCVSLCIARGLQHVRISFDLTLDKTQNNMYRCRKHIPKFICRLKLEQKSCGEKRIPAFSQDVPLKNKGTG